MSHTPGPWDCGPHADELIGRYEVNAGSGPQRSHVCECHGNRRQSRKVTDPEALANARLIAAAPELLAALKAMRNDYGSFYKGNCYITVAYEAKLAEANRIADRAIAKAEGITTEGNHGKDRRLD